MSYDRQGERICAGESKCPVLRGRVGKRSPLFWFVWSFCPRVSCTDSLMKRRFFFSLCRADLCHVASAYHYNASACERHGTSVGRISADGGYPSVGVRISVRPRGSGYPRMLVLQKNFQLATITKLNCSNFHGSIFCLGILQASQ